MGAVYAAIRDHTVILSRDPVGKCLYSRLGREDTSRFDFGHEPRNCHAEAGF